MSRIPVILLSALLFWACNNYNNSVKRIAVAQVGKTILYYDDIPGIIRTGLSESDSAAVIQNYINKWAKRELLLQKAEDNLSVNLKNEIEQQISETKANLLIYQYQRQMMLEKMDTIVSDTEMENYFVNNESSFILTSNIVKALFIKLPIETPNLIKIKQLARSNKQDDIQKLEGYCYQFAEKFDDFGEKWIPMDRLSVELKNNIENEESFLRRNSFFETSDSGSVYLISIREYKLRSTLAPFEYVKDDIKRIILNNRRFKFIQMLENGIYNEALKENSFKTY